MNEYIANLVGGVAVLESDTPAGWENYWRQAAGMLEASRIVDPEEDDQGQPVVSEWQRPKRRRVLNWVRVAGCAAVLVMIGVTLVLLMV